MNSNSCSNRPVQVGFALTGSFCTFHQVIEQMEAVAAHPDWQVIPILSPNAYETDTRFGKAADFREQIERICGHEIWHTIAQTEPIGPKKLLDVLLVAPCTGNTLGKLANGITDTSVTQQQEHLLCPDASGQRRRQAGLGGGGLYPDCPGGGGRPAGAAGAAAVLLKGACAPFSPFCPQNLLRGTSPPREHVVRLGSCSPICGRSAPRPG